MKNFHFDFDEKVVNEYDFSPWAHNCAISLTSSYANRLAMDDYPKRAQVKDDILLIAPLYDGKKLLPFAQERFKFYIGFNEALRLLED